MRSSNHHEPRREPQSPEVVIGDGAAIGWIYDLNNYSLVRVCESASEHEVMVAFSRIMGYDL